MVNITDRRYTMEDKEKHASSTSEEIIVNGRPLRKEDIYELVDVVDDDFQEEGFKKPEKEITISEMVRMAEELSELHSSANAENKPEMEIAALSSLNAQSERDFHDMERIIRETLPDVARQIMKEMLPKIAEKFIEDRFPQIAERIIREEIQKLKDDTEE